MFLYLDMTVCSFLRFLGDPSLFIYASFCFIYDPLFLNAQPFGVFYEVPPPRFMSYICFLRYYLYHLKKSGTVAEYLQNHKNSYSFSTSKIQKIVTEETFFEMGLILSIICITILL